MEKLLTVGRAEDGMSVSMSLRRPPNEIIRDIAQTYGGLSPENLYCDGELSARKAEPKRRRLEKKLHELFREYGRKVDEGEAYELSREYRTLGPPCQEGADW